MMTDTIGMVFVLLALITCIGLLFWRITQLDTQNRRLKGEVVAFKRILQWSESRVVHHRLHCGRLFETDGLKYDFASLVDQLRTTVLVYEDPSYVRREVGRIVSN